MLLSVALPNMGRSLAAQTRHLPAPLPLNIAPWDPTLSSTAGQGLRTEDSTKLVPVDILPPAGILSLSNRVRDFSALACLVPTYICIEKARALLPILVLRLPRRSSRTVHIWSSATLTQGPPKVCIPFICPDLQAPLAIFHGRCPRLILGPHTAKVYPLAPSRAASYPLSLVRPCP